MDYGLIEKYIWWPAILVMGCFYGMCCKKELLAFNTIELLSFDYISL